MSLTAKQLSTLVPFYSDKAQSQLDSFTNAARLIKRDARELLCTKQTYEFGVDKEGEPLETAEVAGDLIAIVRLKDGADINWHNIEILVDDDADTFTCEMGLLNDDGTFELKATLGTPEDNVGTAVVPGPDEPLLTEPKWVVGKITGTPPTAGKATFYVPYIALA